MTIVRRAVCMLFALVVSAATLQAQTNIVLEWDASALLPSGALGGYIVGIGTTPGTYTSEREFGNVLKALLTVPSGSYVAVRTCVGIDPATRMCGLQWSPAVAARVPGATSPNGATAPPDPSLTDAAGGVWTLAADRKILRDGVQVGDGAADQLLWWNGNIYANAFGMWYQHVAGIWAKLDADPRSSEPTPPPPVEPPPAPSVCTTDPLKVTGIKWPGQNTGSRSITFSVGTKRWTRFGVEWKVDGHHLLTVTDSRGCTVLITK